MPRIDDERWVGALPANPLNRHAVATNPWQRVGFGQALLLVSDVPLEPPFAVRPTAPLSEMAGLLRREQAGYLAVTDEDALLLGAVWIDDLLARVAADRPVATARDVLSPLIPSCRPLATIADAVREMLTSYVRRIPVVSDDGRLLGHLPLSQAVAHCIDDPAIRDVLAQAAFSPSLWARRWR